ncbi:TPA: hypothetical protein HA259_00665 [Thermoplasmata archaeon]|nr:hypothetical protein [Thermoplasmata archaeon]
MIGMLSSYQAELRTTSTSFSAFFVAFSSVASSFIGVTLFSSIALATSFTLSRRRSAATTSALYASTRSLTLIAPICPDAPTTSAFIVSPLSK